ncbi:MAG: hypothetical protein AVDCRST_MAG52-1558, partial [uncultured Blastococcus sp.]
CVRWGGYKSDTAKLPSSGSSGDDDCAARRPRISVHRQRA